MKIAIIIPSYNPTKKIVKLVNELQKDFDNILIVDDGSTEETKRIYKELNNVKIIYQNINKGKGQAIKTGIKELKNVDAFITVDADLQHKPKDVLKIKESKNTGVYNIVFTLVYKRRNKFNNFYD